MAGKQYQIKEVAGKGVGIFATQDIRPGTCLFTEDPIVTFNMAMIDVRPEMVEEAYEKLNDLGRSKYDGLRYESGSNTSLNDLSNMSDWLRRDLRIKQFNFNHHGTTNPRTGQKMSGVYDLLSRMNHSCIPNVRIGRADEETTQKQCKAVSHIKMGEEITFSYVEGAMFMTTAERKADLGPIGLPFKCLCEAWSSFNPHREISDMRRHLLRHIRAMIYENDLEFVPTTPAIEKLKRRLPLERYKSDAFFHGQQLRRSILFAVLADAEGLTASREMFRSYYRAAILVVKIRLVSGEQRLSSIALVNARKWMGRAEELARNFPEDCMAGSHFAVCREAIEAIGPGGEIPGVVRQCFDRPRQSV